MKFRATDRIESKNEKAIFDKLLEYNLARLEDKTPKDLGVYYESDTGDILGGLIGNTHGNWLSVKYLWVEDDLRGQGIGSELLGQAEAIAKERGCKYAFLDRKLQ